MSEVVFLFILFHFRQLFHRWQIKYLKRNTTISWVGRLRPVTVTIFIVLFFSLLGSETIARKKMGKIRCVLFFVGSVGEIKCVLNFNAVTNRHSSATHLQVRYYSVRVLQLATTTFAFESIVSLSIFVPFLLLLLLPHKKWSIKYIKIYTLLRMRIEKCLLCIYHTYHTCNTEFTQIICIRHVPCYTCLAQ